jgi:predicted esterase
MFNNMRDDIAKTIKSVIQLVYFMRGSISYNDMMNMTQMEREMVNDFISERLAQEAKRANPVY